MPTVKIFVSYKDNHKLLKNDIITPIQTGRALSDVAFEGMIGDNTGDNISKDNERYNELSAQYWVWKHYDEIGDPEYVGFMHYRRHFIFDKNFDTSKLDRWLNKVDIYNVDSFDAECLENLSCQNINKTLSNESDCYVIKPYDIRFFKENDLYMKEHYINTIPGAKRIVWDAFYNAVKKMYPDYENILEEFTYGHFINCCNMFIMKKELFFEYSKFCFDILNEIDRTVDSTNFDKNEIRFLGYLGEYLLTIFIMKLKKENKKIEFLDAIYIKNIDQKTINKKPNKFFSYTKNDVHSVLYILGIKFTIGKNSKRAKYRNIINQLKVQDEKIDLLIEKINDLQEELLKNKV